MSNQAVRVASLAGKRILGLPVEAFLFLLVLQMLYTPLLGSWEYIGITSCVIILLAGIISLLAKPVKNRYLLVLLLITAVYLAIRMIGMEFSNAIYLFTQQVVLLAFALALCEQNLNEATIERLRLALSRLFVVFFVLVVVLFLTVGEEFVIHRLGGTILNVLFPLSYFFLSRKRHILIWSILLGLAFLLIDERISAILLLALPILYKVLYKIRNKRNLLMGVFIASCALVLILPVGYTLLSYTSVGKQINAYTVTHAKENLFSGRQLLWHTIFEKNTNMLLGEGVGNTVMQDEGITKSPHNIYMFLYLQGGLINVFLLLLWLGGIWKTSIDKWLTHRSAMHLSFIILSMLFTSFTLTLLTNNSVTAVFLWILICFSSMSMSEREEIHVVPNMCEGVDKGL